MENVKKLYKVGINIYGAYGYRMEYSTFNSEYEVKNYIDKLKKQGYNDMIKITKEIICDLFYGYIEEV